MIQKIPTDIASLTQAFDILENSEPREAVRECEKLYDELLNQYPQNPGRDYTATLKMVSIAYSKLYSKLHAQLNQPEETA